MLNNNVNIHDDSGSNVDFQVKTKMMMTAVEVVIVV